MAKTIRTATLKYFFPYFFIREVRCLLNCLKNFFRMWICPKGTGLLKLHNSKYVYGNHGTWRVCSNCGRMEEKIGYGRGWYWKVIDYGREN
jgi:hypothetical protein